MWHHSCVCVCLRGWLCDTNLSIYFPHGLIAKITYHSFIGILVSFAGLSETAVMDLIANNLQQQRNMVDQLRREANIQRMPVSQACADIVKYVTEHEQEDCLLVGFSSQKVNPFREKSSCQIL